MRVRVLAPVLALSAIAGVWVWWMQGGFGGPVSDGPARSYFARIVAAAQAKDFDALCRLNSSVGPCQFEMNAYCPDPTVPRPLQIPRDILEQECRKSVPTEPPEIVASRHYPAKGDSVGGRLLVVSGVDGRGNAYETEVLIFRDKRSYKAIHALFWSGSKFPTSNETKPEPPR